MTCYTHKDVHGNEFHLVEADGIVYSEGYIQRMECGGFRRQMEHVRDMEIRDDDVLIAAYPKSGMHWLWEIVSMVLNNRAEYDKNAKEHAMLDFRSKEHVENLPSQRILNMHFPVRLLPRQLLEKKRPVIHVMRNPKDLFVSYFHHFNFNTDNKVTSFSAFLSALTGENGYYLVSNSLDPDETPSYSASHPDPSCLHILSHSGEGSEWVKWKSTEISIDRWLINATHIRMPWFQYELEWEEFTKKNPDYPILNIYYEDMKKDPEKSIAGIASFLHCDISKELIQEIAAKTDIKAMQAGVHKVKENGPRETVDGVLLMYRKGMIGDWKNYFTVAESEKMDKWLEKNLVNTNLKFQYT